MGSESPTVADEPIPTSEPIWAGPIVLFDGECKLCDWSVQFLIDRDPRARLRFAAIQSPMGQRLMAQHGLDPEPRDSMVLVEGERAWTHSSAALRVTRFLRAPWPVLSAALIIPKFVRDVGYRLIARNRYRWFGKYDSCRRSTPELLARFLD